LHCGLAVPPPLAGRAFPVASVPPTPAFPGGLLVFGRDRRLAMSTSTNRRTRGARRGSTVAADTGATAKRGSRAPRAPKRVEPANDRASIYDEVTQRIVGELEAGRVPWVQPWAARGADGLGAGAGVALPRNAASRRPYSGINILILWGAVIANGWPSQGWLTFRQALDAGGAVRKGERGTTVVYADRFVPKEADKAGLRGSAAPAKGNEPPEAVRSVPFLKRFTVFNVAQIDGLPEGFSPDPVPLPEREIVPVAEDVIAASGVTFQIGGDRAFYVPSLDYVAVPPQPAFFDQINYYRTALHELTHATGHAKRLGRDLTNGFGSKGYAFEELVAEMGSAFLCAALGIVPTVRHADYLASWLAVLKEDNRAIFRAASQASKAADWLLARHGETRAAAMDVAA